MSTPVWPTKRLPVTRLFLDDKNPRLGRETGQRAPRELIQYMFDHDKALDIAQSIATRGYFPSEPLLGVASGRTYIIVEGNRRLAALKALIEPGLLTGRLRRTVERLSRRASAFTLSPVPVCIAPNRRATDRLLAGRHIGTPVLPWRSENRASFILSKLEEGYSHDDLLDELGFTATDIQSAKQTRATAEMARSLPLPPEVKARIDNPRIKVLTTVERVIESSVGRNYLGLETDNDHGLRGVTTKKEFVRAFTQLVSDIALQKETSRSLNKTADISDYFNNRNPKAIAARKRGRFVPADVIEGTSVTTPPASKPVKKPRRINPTVLPRNFKVRYGNDRLVDIHGELTKMKREQLPNAGAVLLRVFLELSIRDYLKRTGRLQVLEERLKSKNKLPRGRLLTMRDMTPEIVKVARKYLGFEDATIIEKALRHDAAAPFSISDLHAFVHHTDFPGERDIFQFWSRTEPLFRLMLEQGPEESTP